MSYAVDSEYSQINASEILEKYNSKWCEEVLKFEKWKLKDIEMVKFIKDT